MDAAWQFYLDKRFDLHDLDVFPLYTKRVLQTRQPDPGNVLGCESDLDFEESARKFKMIDDAGVSIVVPYGEGWERVQQVRRDGPSRDGLRGLQRYTVTVYERELYKLKAAGFVELLFAQTEEAASEEKQTWVVRGDLRPLPYSERFGLSVQEDEGSTIMA